MNARRSGGFTIIELALVCAILLLLTAISIPAMYASRQSANEALAASTLRTIHPIQTAFRQGDLDRNGQADFWTLDVGGLHRLLGPDGAPLNLVSAEIAAADACPGTGPGLAPGGEHRALRGYHFRSMLLDRAGRALQVDGPDADTLAREHPDRFGFTAYPAVWDSSRGGAWVFIMMEDGQIWTRNLSGRGPGGAGPAGTTGVAVDGGQLTWPGPAGSTDLKELPSGPWQIVH
ncbi:MAG: type II secretion system protein [Candidatus Brocadiae bacterium]|nr:type II secretion system protein [Candidatus Brocadiia bacterium]